MQTRRRAIFLWAVTSAVFVESITLYFRFHHHLTVTDFNKSAPLLLQIHHMFWSIPFLLLLPFTWRKPILSGTLLGIALGFILSDLLHHFLILPLLVGNTGWHWP